MARAQWVALEHDDALSAAEIKRYLRQSYALVFAKLTKKMQSELSAPPAKPAKRAR
jgi:predicted DNA-binding protein (MmcQ/YjbR family)